MLFSNICNFTTIIGSLSSAQLLQWVGYIFRVMDSVAEHYHVYKVKACFVVVHRGGFLFPTRGIRLPRNQLASRLLFSVP